MDCREAIENYLGRPEDHEFNIEEYKGTRGGLINVLGLRHKGIIIAGNSLYHIVQAHNATQLNRWDFMHALQSWCEEYVGKVKVPIGEHTIIRGQLSLGNSRYFCVPSDKVCSAVN